jgi:hypothetical protein
MTHAHVGEALSAGWVLRRVTRYASMEHFTGPGIPASRRPPCPTESNRQQEC